MYRKRYVCLGISAFFCALFLAVGVAGPIILEGVIQDTVNQNMQMKESNADTWGLVPGHTRVHINREFFFFNVSNPEDIKWNGAKPLLAQTFDPYRYLEVDHYMERVFVDDEEAGQDYVRFRRYQWFNKTTDWSLNISESDRITQVNVGALSAWEQMKHLPAETIALAALYSVISGLDAVLLPSAIALGIATTLYPIEGNYYYELIFEPAGIERPLADILWHDPVYGWNNSATFAIWIEAEMQCFVDDKCVYFPNLGGTIYILKEFFGLTDNQMESLLEGWLQDSYITLSTLLSNWYGCPTEICKSHYLTALQWSSQGVTNNPPPPAAKIPSVAFMNSTIHGYPEISYFQSVNYPPGSALSQVTFTVAQALSLLDYNLKTGWPSGSNFTLLDVGHMNQFFALGRAGNFAGMQTLLGLTSPLQGQVLFDYFNELVAVTALQNRTDQETYNQGNRGLTNELSLGNLVSQVLSSFYYGLSEPFAVELTARYAFVLFTSLGLDCETVVKNTGVSTAFCKNNPLSWNVPSSLDIWVLTYWNGEGSPYWQQFQDYSGLSRGDMLKLFDPTLQLVKTLAQADSNLHQHYGCHNPGSRCTHYELFIQQWSFSSITYNPPPLTNWPRVYSMLDWGAPFDQLLPAAPEYSAYERTIGTFDVDSTIVYSVAVFLLSPMGLLNQVQCQRYFTLLFDYEVLEQPTDINITSEFQILNITAFSDYLRRTVDKFVLGELFITKTVKEWLWTGSSPLLTTLANTNPLQGGNPAINPTQVQLGQNTTRASLRFPDHYKHAMITGKKNIESKLRWWFLFYGNPNVTLYTQVYMGHTPEGPIITYQNLHVWDGEPEPIKGGDALSFQTNINSDSDVWLYLDPFLRYGQGSYDHHHKVSGMDVYRFTVSSALLQNATENPDNAKYYCFGPSGAVNMTPVLSGPLFISKPYFYGGNSDALLSVLDFSTQYEEDLSIYDSYFDLEHFTGAVFSEQEKLMTMAELRSDALYPMMGTMGYNMSNIWTYLPIFFMNRSSYYPDSRVFLT